MLELRVLSGSASAAPDSVDALPLEDVQSISIEPLPRSTVLVAIYQQGFEAMRSLDRHQVRVYRSHAEADDGGYMPGTPGERLSQVWELTKDAWAFFRGADAERRLQRHAAVLIRRKS